MYLRFFNMKNNTVCFVHLGHCRLFNQPIYPALLRPIKRHPDQDLFDIEQEIENE